MFKDLIADLKGFAGKAELLKSTPAGDGDADDKNIQNAGATGGDSGDGGEGAAGAAAAGAAGAAGAKDGEEDDKDQPLAKSFEVTLENGQKFSAVDAGDLLKSFNTRLADMESATGEAVGLSTELIKSLFTQVSNLSAEVAKLRGAGTGRVAVLSIAGKTATAATGNQGGNGQSLLKAEDQGMKPQDFLLKAEQKFNAQQLTGRELGEIETYINRGLPIPTAYIQKVMSA